MTFMTSEAPREPAAVPERRPLDFRWRPVRALAPRHRPRILAHLLALDDNDRHLRFGYVASDTHIRQYVDQIDFERDEVFGVFNRRLEIVAMAHLAYLGHDLRHPNSAEFGVSVLPRQRGCGLGARLFDRSALRARNHGVDTLIVHSLTENKVMLRIASSAGAAVERDGPDSTARLKLPADDFASHLLDLVEDQAAEVDYGLRLHARRVADFLDTLREGVAATDAPPSDRSRDAG